VRKGLRALTITKGKEYLNISFPIFGHTIKDYGYSYDKEKEYRKAYKHDRCLKMLCEN
jgi:hypothetical protein